MSVGAEIELSAREARGVALAAQGLGLGRRRPNGRIDARRLRRAIDDVGLLQLDSVNVLCRSHYMPLFSRLGPYPRATLDRLASHADTAAGAATRAGRDRALFEYWGHEASLLPVELQPLLRWRMARAEKFAEKPARLLAAEKPELLQSVLRTVGERGPVRAAELATPVRRPKNPWYNWSEAKIALDYLFFAGLVCADHRVRFERRYDLPERVLPKAVLDAPTPPEDEAQRQLLLIAAARLGVATEPDLGDYFRLPRKESKARLTELVEAGALDPARVEGWSAPAYVTAGRLPAPVREARALLTPFDPLVWSRPRTERVFGFRHRIELYTPAAKRVHGYYVLPFLLGDGLVARIDVKSDRAAGVLRVLGAFAEPGADPGAVAVQLADELRLLARWLDLEDVSVAGKGDLAGKLAKAVTSAQEPPHTHTAGQVHQP
ncbi:winged helix-turn-helix domain-containing protein [Streptomyces bathyalis]|uniref:Winged helix-turn-helix domain-containing protein n=1 Tax=Streptomyces bathyalis TaxID=2710756 RepID=A0A7T1TD09_9ACTN|nr:winged helix-turn-helix domain-containing protein [Streptomyces bathyalis]